MYDYIKTGNSNQQQAEWEAKTKRNREANILKAQKAQFDSQQKKFLDMRRKKLSDLLQREEHAYIQEIIQKQETPEQVRYKMEEKLIALRSQREAERQELVRKLNEKRFYDSADQLRKNDSEAFAISCYLEQENQMLDKMKRQEKERREEEVFVKLNEFDNMKKLEKEKMEMLAKKEKEKETYAHLKWQLKEHEDLLKKENELKELENARLKEQWRLDDENEEANKRKQFEINKKVYQDIEDFNRREEVERKKKSDYEKVKDKELIDSIVEKEKALDQLDKLEKERKIKEFHQNKKYLEHVMAQKKEAESWMDKLAQEEADREYKKEQEQWLKEEAKRIELLKNVYKEREKAVMYKLNLRDEEKKQIEKERAILDEEIKQYNIKIAEINKQNAMRRKEHQHELLYQISEKENQKRRELQDKLYEERAAQLWEMEYQKKINQQREIHLKKLQEIKNRNGV